MTSCSLALTLNEDECTLHLYLTYPLPHGKRLICYTHECPKHWYTIETCNCYYLNILSAILIKIWTSAYWMCLLQYSSLVNTDTPRRVQKPRTWSEKVTKVILSYFTLVTTLEGYILELEWRCIRSEVSFLARWTRLKSFEEVYCYTVVFLDTSIDYAVCSNRRNKEKE